jgi:hypothetical protein
MHWSLQGSSQAQLLACNKLDQVTFQCGAWISEHLQTHDVT